MIARIGTGVVGTDVGVYVGSVVAFYIYDRLFLVPGDPCNSLSQGLVRTIRKKHSLNPEPKRNHQNM